MKVAGDKSSSLRKWILSCYENSIKFWNMIKRVQSMHNNTIPTPYMVRVQSLAQASAASKTQVCLLLWDLSVVRPSCCQEITTWQWISWLPRCTKKCNLSWNSWLRTMTNLATDSQPTSTSWRKQIRRLLNVCAKNWIKEPIRRKAASYSPSIVTRLQSPNPSQQTRHSPSQLKRTKAITRRLALNPLPSFRQRHKKDRNSQVNGLHASTTISATCLR